MICAVYTNADKDKDCNFTKNLLEYLDKRHVSSAVHKSIAGFFPHRKTFTGFTSVFDLAFVIGGDGTILRVAAACARANVPIFGFNCGHTGFLSESETNGFENIIEHVLYKKYSIEERSMLSCCAGNKKAFALNDIVLNRAYGKLIAIDVFSGGKFIDSHYCDGFIVSTPTGSTAYSLSAGGPIISPAASVIALTPINSHTQHSRPIVVGDDEKITLSLSQETNRAALYCDGNLLCKLNGGDEVHSVISPFKAKFIRLENYNFYEKLLHKLYKWGVVNAVKE